MKTTTDWLSDLIRRVPVRAVDIAAARRAGDTAAIAYAEAVREWQDEAAVAIAEAEQHSGPSASRQQPADAYARAAAASALLRLDAAG